MKTAVDKNESSFAKMKRESLEWLERNGKAAPPFIALAVNLSHEPVTAKNEQEKPCEHCDKPIPCNLECEPSESAEEMTFDLAEKLAKETDYACEATHTDINPINWGDAAAFFLEGYKYASQKHLPTDCYPKEFVEWCIESTAKCHPKGQYVEIEGNKEFKTLDELFIYWRDKIK